jgi:hypothetical protein
VLISLPFKFYRQEFLLPERIKTPDLLLAELSMLGREL